MNLEKLNDFGKQSGTQNDHPLAEGEQFTSEVGSNFSC